jgi:hypothetical protein
MKKVDGRLRDGHSRKRQEQQAGTDGGRGRLALALDLLLLCVVVVVIIVTLVDKFLQQTVNVLAVLFIQEQSGNNRRALL